MNDQRRTVNLPQACVIAGRCRRTLYYWIKTGKVRSERTEFGLRIMADSLPKREERAA